MRRNGWRRLATLAALGLAAALFSLIRYESYASLYDAQYVGAATCGDCHTQMYEQWRGSPHDRMTRPADAPGSILGDFEQASWTLPESARSKPGDDQPAARMYREGDHHYMALRDPKSGGLVPFRIDYVVGYQFRQTYLTREAGGVLRRLPLEWSLARREYFPYWNYQEGSQPSLEDLWQQMTTLNSAWNLFCARCHTTHLEIAAKDAAHTRADTRWVDDGIACEACHGPGSQHVNYFAHNYVNRVVAFLNSRLRGQPVAFIANPSKLTRGQDLSTCARCHGPDIERQTTEIYRVYEPGYSWEGRINDLSPHFKEFPLEPGRQAETVEVWADGTAKGIGMVFRSFIESACYEKAEVRCYDCHDPHDNDRPARAGLLEPSAASNGYCLGCHDELGARLAEHTQHRAGTPGSFCYDCHMSRRIVNLASGTSRWTRTHTMSHLPDPSRTLTFGPDGSPNACNECHADRSAAWAAERVAGWTAPRSASRQNPAGRVLLAP
jgi:hypothetical protein